MSKPLDATHRSLHYSETVNEISKLFTLIAFEQRCPVIFVIEYDACGEDDRD